MPLRIWRPLALATALLGLNQIPTGPAWASQVSPKPSLPPPPTFLVWTLPGRPVGGVSFGPKLFHLSIGANRLQDLLGHAGSSPSDAWGMRRWGWPQLGVEATASPDGRLLALAFLLRPQSRGSVSWPAADVATDRGFRAGGSMAQARALHGPPTRTRPATDGPGVVWVYALARGSELELAFPKAANSAKAISLTLY